MQAEEHRALALAEGGLLMGRSRESVWQPFERMASHGILISSMGRKLYVYTSHTCPLRALSSWPRGTERGGVQGAATACNSSTLLRTATPGVL